ncbi:MAG: peptidoglycan-binding protein, partial [Clostridiales bacterium]|nr:peptidoglycan-binding protein [Clostridiales bacterium]
KAVERFQTLNALKADGVFGSQSAQVLLSGSARRADDAPLTYKTLRIDNRDGSDGAIRAMQERLKALGYRVSVNGTFDILTHEAVVAFQRRNSLTVSGVADAVTQAKLHASDAKDTSVAVEDPGADEGKGGGPPVSSVKLLHWFNDVKPSVSSRQNVTVHDPRSGISFTIRFYALGSHADSELATLSDTLLMNRAFGLPSWDVHTVYVKLPSGAWTLASMHNRPHLTGSVSNNGFGGHLCIHFLRDLDETQRNDPNYGMANQRAIRQAWLSMTGETVE